MKTMFAIGEVLRDHGKFLMSHDTAEFSVVTREALDSGRAYETAVRYKWIRINGREETIIDNYDDARAAIAGHNRHVETLTRLRQDSA